VSATCQAKGKASVTITGGVAPYTYIWTELDSTTAISKTIDTLGTTDVVSLAAGYYVVTITDSECMAERIVDTVHVGGNSAPSITIKGDTLISSVIHGNQWYRNDTLISGATDQTYIAAINGVYYTTVSGCSSSPVNYPTGINQLSVRQPADQLSVYPNPTSDELTIISNQVSIQKIEIDNVLGETMLIYAPQFNKAGTAVNLDVSHLADGMYFVRITLNNEMITRKVIVSR
jgi:hypothetical protein